MSKGGGKAHVPYEQPDNLESKQILTVVDLLCEGEIDGPKEGLKSVYLNDTPIQSSTGAYNFKGIDAEWVSGSQAQLPLEGFPATENEIPVGLSVKKATPIVRTITDKNIDRLRVTVGTSALYQQKDNGDVVGTSVNLEISVEENGEWKVRSKVEIKGKTRSQFLRSIIIADLPATPFNVRVSRITNDSDSIKLANATLWSSYTEIYDIKLSYPNTAVAGLKFDSSQFQGVPRRNYLIRGMIVKIPTNYFPETREYKGMWDGSFKTGWTDNPAWVLYDIIINKRYGLGSKVGSFGVDKFQLYSISRYCDALVPNGFGGKEPRFTCNMYITTQRQAYDVINDLCSIFRAMPVWDGTKLTAIVDRASDPVAIYTNANVVDGIFNYSSSAKKDRHNAVHVKYLDKENGWRGATEYVADDKSITKNGLNVRQIEAFACTSRGQAHRIGKWIIETEKLEKQSVTFSLGREGLRHLPGDIVIIVDNGQNPARIGGRIKQIDGNTVTLDRDVKDIVSGDFFTYIDKKGKQIQTIITSLPEPNKVVLEDIVDGEPTKTIWSISQEKNITHRKFKAISISENQDGTYQVSAVQHNENKEKIVDAGAVFDPEEPPVFPTNIPPIEQLTADLTTDSDFFQLTLRWSVPRTVAQLKFEIKIMKDDNIVKRAITDETIYSIGNLDLGKYTAYVRGVNNEGRVGDESAVSFTIAPPPKPVQIDFKPDINTVMIIPRSAPGTSLGTFFEFYKGKDEAEVLSEKNYLGRGTSLVDTDCTPDTQYWYGAKSRNVVGSSEMVTGNTTTLKRVGGGGGIFRIQTDDGVFPPTSDETTELFYNHFGFYPDRDTVLILYSLDSEGNVDHSENKLYDGNKWIIPALFIDGDLIATGTIVGDRIKSNTEIIAATIVASDSIKTKTITTGVGYLLPTPGEIKLFPFRANELPPGWYACDGKEYDVKSSVGEALQSLSLNYKTDWGIKITSNKINTPNLVPDGNGFFIRAVDGASRQVGSSQGDAIRNITGSFGSTIRWSGDWGLSGAFSFDSSGSANIASGDRDDWLRKINLDLKNINYPLADEIRPKNIGMIAAIYIGV